MGIDNYDDGGGRYGRNGGRSNERDRGNDRGNDRGDRGNDRGDRGGDRGGRGGRSGGGRGGSRGGSRGGGRGGRGGGRGGYSGGGRGGRGRGERGGRRHPREMAASGNQRERIAVESGFMVLIDQFMLANPQFAARLVETLDAGPEVKDQLVRDYGGVVVELNPGTYRIDRDPFDYVIVVHAEGDHPDRKSLRDVATGENGKVYVDTRCLAMIDRELLDDTDLLQRYQELWFGGQEKACRDLLRDNGGAVRYGFDRFGDELEVHSVPGEDVVCLWPKEIPQRSESSRESVDVAPEGAEA